MANVAERARASVDKEVKEPIELLVANAVVANAVVANAVVANAVSESQHCEEYTYGSEPSDSDNDIDSNENEVRSIELEGKGHQVRYNKLSYNAIKRHINKSYQQDVVHRYSAALDILASYLKGQKIIYMEARSYTVSILNCLMLPSILMSALGAILQEPLCDITNGSLILSILSAFVTFLLAIINYLKLDAEAEAHKISAHEYDKLQSLVEFQSGEVLLFSNPILNPENARWQEQDKDEDLQKRTELNDLRLAAETELIQRMRENIKQIEERIDGIKVINQFIIPTTIRYKYARIYDTNIFAVIKKIDDYRAKTLTDLKHVKNELRFINAMQKQNIQIYNQRAAVLFKRKRVIIGIILKLNTAYSMIDNMFQQEIDDVKLRQQHWLSFYVNELWCCLPTDYAKRHRPTADILEQIMGAGLSLDMEEEV